MASKKKVSMKTQRAPGMAAVCMAFPLLALAQESQVPPEEKLVSPAMESGAKLALANQLAEYGYSNNNLLALILAAEIKKQTPTQEREGEPVSNPPANIQGSDKEASTGNDVESLLARARELAGNQQDLIAAIDDVEAMQSRAGDAAGPGCYNGRVYPGYTDTWTITYTPGSNWVELSGDGDTDLDLYVYSGDNRLLCSGTSIWDGEFCSWRQTRRGNIRVDVINYGDVWNGYQLCTN
jgi:hypothetical protein